LPLSNFGNDLINHRQISANKFLKNLAFIV
jgi:hypothetical protein